MATTPENKNIKLQEDDYTKPSLKDTGPIQTADGVMSMSPGKKTNTDALSITFKNKNLMKQVNNFGESFPMLKPDEAPHLNPMEAAKTPEITNRAGGPQGRNVLVADQNNPQPLNKIPASSYQRNQMFNDIASSQGQMNPATTTPQVQTFPPQQGMASYANPAKIDNTTAEEIIKGGRSVQNSLNSAMDKVGGITSDEDKDKDKALGMYDGPGSQETPKLGPMSMNKYDGLNLTQKQEDGLNPNLKAAIEGAEGKAPGMYGKHTKITKGNVNAAMKDDAAHASYLKRDINYDAKHGGSKKNMTADEKHISKLAGDIKYDAHKKRKYDNV